MRAHLIIALIALVLLPACTVDGKGAQYVCHAFNGEFQWKPGTDPYCTRGPLGWLWKRENLPQPTPQG